MAVQIYSKIGDGYKLNTKGLNSILKDVEDLPIAIYSVCGPLRQGKSFLLSIFLRYLKSQGRQDWIRDPLENFFKYRSGSTPETTGIYIWGEPFILQKSDGSKVALLLVDSQGSFDNKTEMEENAIVFALCSLLSSHLIFNLKNQISEDILQFLQFFAGFTRLALDEKNQDESFQKLLFLVRDFEHGDYPFGYFDDTVSIDGKNFKKDIINPQPGSPAQVKYVHEMILDTFASVAVYLMPHPGQELARNGNFDLSKVDSEFVRHLEKLTSAILKPENIIPKVIGGQVVTGRQMKLLVEGWARAFSEKLPETKTLFQTAAQVQHEMAKDAAIKNYEKKLKQFVEENKDGVSDAQLEDIHRQVSQECIVLFNGFKKIGDKVMNQQYLNALPEAFEKIFETYRMLNQSHTEMAVIKANAEAIREDLARKLAETNEQMSKLREDQVAERNQLTDQIISLNRDRVAAEQITNEKIQQLESNIREQKAENQRLANTGRGGRRGFCVIS